MFKSFRFLFRYICFTNSCTLFFSIANFLNCHSFYLFLGRIFNKLSQFFPQERRHMVMYFAKIFENKSYFLSYVSFFSLTLHGTLRNEPKSPNTTQFGCKTTQNHPLVFETQLTPAKKIFSRIIYVPCHC